MINPARCAILFGTRSSLLMAALLLCICCAAPAFAGNLYVDNIQGDDAFDGRSQRAISNTSGPVKTLRRAMQVMRPGSTIVIANTGIPYQETMQLVGNRHSGFPGAPTRIIGNGAVISGIKVLPATAWEQIGKDLWKFVPWRKGYYQLLLDGKPVTEFRRPEGTSGVPKIPEGQWCAVSGTVYYQAKPLEDPQEENFFFAAKTVGLSLYRVRHLRVENISFQHFRVDGISIPDLCKDIILDNVTCYENGRAGISVGGSSSVIITNSEIADNRLSQLRIAGKGKVEVKDTAMSAPPTILP